jgi:hypothetical protein
MNWYKTLDIHTRINLKDLSYLICGMKFTDMLLIFTLSEAIEILHNKLIIEGFNV